MPTTGRPSKLTPATHQAIIDTITEGNYFEIACAVAGVHRTSGYNWMERGSIERERIESGITDEQRAEQGIPPAHEERRFLDFFDAVERARALAERSHSGNIKRIAMGGQVLEEEDILDPETGKLVGRKRKLSIGDWRASAFYLERTAARRWGRRQTVEVAPGESGGSGGVDPTDGMRIAERLRDFLSTKQDDPRIVEAEVTSRRDELIGPPVAIESRDRSGDDAR